MFPRYVEKKIKIALKDTPVVMISGPRQCGKTTLAKQLIDDKWSYITFDDTAQLEIAKNDPVGFIRNLPSEKTVLDEVQRIPELFVCIKQSVDENRKPGRFLLTGSANAMLIPKLSDALAGRIEIIQMLPLSEGEIRSHRSTFLSKVIANKLPSTKEVRLRKSLVEKIVSGGFPEPLSRDEDKRRFSWYSQYVNTLIQRDLKDISNIEELNVIHKFLQLLANNVGSITNYTKMGAAIGISRQSASRYLSLLKQLYIVEELPGWYNNKNKRLVKSSKPHLIDTGLLCGLKRINTEKINNDPELFGHLLENYVFCELKKQETWLDEPISFFHYRDKDMVEVDFVLETISGCVLGIEVKASATLTKKDFQGLEKLKKTAGEHFKMGLLLYDGDNSASFGDKLYALPLGCLWW